MIFSKKKYPDRILSISLEDFTANPRDISIKIYEFCGLNWDENCLNFYKRKDLFINTASKNQMRSAIKKYDNLKYQPYKEMLNNYLKEFDWLDYKN